MSGTVSYPQQTLNYLSMNEYFFLSLWFSFSKSATLVKANLKPLSSFQML